MKILIVTQVVNTEHPILGFFHRWIEEFAKHYELVHVVCLEEGTHALPANVTIHSLGKETSKNKFLYLLKFYKQIWQLRGEYDVVFVHMNQLYVVLGYPVWKLLRKKIGLWYTHGSTSLSLKIATLLTNRVFTASPDSFKIKSNKVLVTGHGIDVNHFAPKGLEKDIDLVTVGRIAESKNLIALVDILKVVREKNDVSLTIVGSAVTDTEKAYEAKLRTHIEKINLTNSVHFIGKVSQSDLPNILNCAKVFVTVAKNGSLDKAMLEAMACGLPIVSMAEGSRSLPLGRNQAISQDDLSTALYEILGSCNFYIEDYVSYVKDTHSLSTLVEKILIP